MEFNNLFPLLVFLLSFAIPAMLILFRFVSKKKYFPEFIICFLAFATLILYHIFAPASNDFIESYDFHQICAPFFSCFLLLFIPNKIFKQYYPFIIPFFAGLIVFGAKLKTPIILTTPSYLNQIIALLLWSFISFCYRINNRISGQIFGFTCIFGFGLFIFSLLGGLPNLLGIIALSMSSSSVAFLLTNKHSLTSQLSTKGSCILGFLVGAFIILSIPEQAFGPTIILSLFPITETTFALLFYLPFIKHSSHIEENTACAKSLSSGLSEQIVTIHSLRIGFLMIIFGCFQLYASSPYSLWLICTIIIVWQQYRLINWQQLSSGIHDANQSFTQGIRENYSNFKKAINKMDKSK